MSFEKKADKLIIRDGVKRIDLSMQGRKLIGWHQDEEGNEIDEYDENQIEIFYYERDEEGFGFGDNEYITSFDIQAMADCIRDVILKKKDKAEYHCQKDLLRLLLSYDCQADSFTFSVGLIETLEGKYHITVTKAGLSRAALEEFIEPFFEWEKKYPVVLE